MSNHRGRRAPVAESAPVDVSLPDMPSLLIGRPNDERHTPRWLFDRLAETFDLDPAAPVDGPRHVPAARWYSVLDNGLEQPWRGFVWLNPPYSNATPWADRMMAHGDGLLLAPLSTSTRWCIDAVRSADAIAPLPELAFEGTTHLARHASFGVVLYGFGRRATAAIGRLDAGYRRMVTDE